MVKLVRRAVEENGQRRFGVAVHAAAAARHTSTACPAGLAQNKPLAAAQLGAGSGSCWKAQAQLEKRRQARVSRSFSCRA